MSTTTKEFVILDKYRLVELGIPYYVAQETFKLTLSLPEGTSIVGAKLVYEIHCVDSGKQLGQDLFAGAWIKMSNQGDVSDMRKVFEYPWFVTCHTESGEQDVYALIVPKRGPDQATNYFEIRCFRMSSGFHNVVFDFSMKLVVTYEGAEPTVTYQKIPQAPTGASPVEAITTFITLLPLIIILWLVTSLLSTIRDLMGRRKKK